jgi:hypothetical protein
MRTACRLLLVIAVLALSASRVASAQTVSGTAAWAPNPTTDHVVQYTVQLNAGTPVVVLPAACTATRCTSVVPAIPVGVNTLTLVAQNVGITGGALQSSPPAVLTFTLNVAPVTVLGVAVTVP